MIRIDSKTKSSKAKSSKPLPPPTVFKVMGDGRLVPVKVKA